MEQEDRKKKLAAGKEKLAAFRKKRAKKKDESDSHTQSFDSTQNSSSNDLEVTSLANVSSLSDLHSFTAEESDMQATLHYQAKLAAATQRIAELEEAVEGKQLALDKMVMEMQRDDPSHKTTEGVLEDIGSFKGSMLELQEALVQRDKIIRQLTAHLQQATVTKASNGVDDDPLDYAQETQQLSQQVSLLQQQLTQAGERVEQQAAMCQMSVGALQEAKSQILALQDKVAEKNSLLHQLSHTLKARNSEVSTLQHREAELQQLVNTLHQQAADSGNDSLKAAKSAATRVVNLEQELQVLSAEHAQSTQAVLDLQRKLRESEAIRQALIYEKELALQKIAGLEEELGQLALVRDETMRKMSALEQQVQENSVLIQAHADSQAIEASEKIAQLEQQIEEFRENHRVQVSQLEQSLAIKSESCETDMHGLRNLINTQQGELLTLHEQVKEKEDELAASRKQLQSLHDQLEQLQSKFKKEQHERASTVHGFQLQIQELREENSHYEQQMTLVQEQICSFRECLHANSLSLVIRGETMNDESCDKISTNNIAGQIKQLQTCYTYLLEQYTEMVEKTNLTQSEVQNSLQAGSHIEGLSTEQKDIANDRAVEITQQQAEVAQLKAAVHRKDVEIGELNTKLRSVSEEKNRLAILVEEQEQVTEQQTLQSDTLQRRMESRVNSLFTEVTEYKEALKESEMANIELQDKLDLKLKEADSLRLQLAASEDLMKDLQNRLNAKGDQQEQTKLNLQKRVSEITHYLSQLQEELQGKEKTLSVLQEQLKERDDDLSELREELQGKEKTLSVLQEQLKERGDEQQQLFDRDTYLSELKDELKEKGNSVSQLRVQLQENNSVVSQLQEQLQEKDSVVSQLQEQLHVKDNVVSQLQEQLQERDSVVSQLKDQLQEKDSVVEKLHKQLLEKEGFTSQIQEQLQEKDSVVSKLQERDNVVSNLEEQLQRKNSVVSELQVQLQEKESAVSELQVQLQEKESAVSELQVQLQEKDSAVSELQVQLQEKDSAVSELQVQLQEKDSVVSELQVQLQEKKSAVSEFQVNLQEKDNVVSELQVQLQEKEIALSELQVQLMEKDSVVSELQVKLQEKDNAVSELHLQLQEKESAVSELQVQLQEKKSAVSELQVNLQEKDCAVSELQVQLQEKDSAVSELQVQVQEKDSAVSELQVQLQEKDCAVSELQVQLQEKESTVSELQVKLQEKESAVSELQVQLQEKDSAVSELQVQLQEKDSAVSELQVQVHEKDSAVSELQVKLQEKDCAVSELQVQMQDRDSTVSQLKEQLQEKNDGVFELEEQLQGKGNIVSQLHEQLQERDSAISELKQQLLIKDGSLSQLQEQLQEQAEEKISAVRQLQDQLSQKEHSLVQVTEQMEGKDATLTHVQKELDEKDKTVQQMKEQFEMNNHQNQTLRSELEASAQEARQQNIQLSEDVEHLRQQLAEVHEQHQAVLVEQEQLVSQYQNRIHRTEENLEHKSAEVKQVLEKKELEAMFSSAEDTKTKHISDMNSRLEEMSKELEGITVEKEKVRTELFSLKTSKDTDNGQNQAKLEEFAERLVCPQTEPGEGCLLLTPGRFPASSIKEKEHNALSFELTKNKLSQQLKDLQEKLEESQEYYQTLLSEKQELVSQQMAAMGRQTELENQLLVKVQENEILLTENEALHEELQSSSSAYMKENKCLKAELSQQSKTLDVLTSELDNLQDKLLSRDSESSHQLYKSLEKLRETGKEIEALKAELRNKEDAVVTKESSMTSLQTEVDSLKERLLQVENAHSAVLQDSDQAVEALHSRVCDLLQELQNSKDEQEVMTSRLAAQADMFRVKQEEMVAENNDLNHQLEEVRNDAQETIHRLQEQLEVLHKQLQATSTRLESQEQQVTQLNEEVVSNRICLQIQEDELGRLREENSQHKDSLGSLKASNNALEQEKEYLLVKIQSLESSIEEIQKQSDDGVAALQSEIQQLKEEKHLQLTEFESEKSLLTKQNASLHEQLDSCTSEIERLQQSLKDMVTEQEKLKTDNSRLQQLTDSLQLDFSSHMDHAQSELAAKDTELQSVQTQQRDSTAQFIRQLKSLQEEIIAAQSEIEQKESSLNSAMEELTATKQQLEHTKEEKDMLKSNFDCCMEEMTRRTTEKDTVIQQLQGRLVEASQNVDRDHVQLREMYESQLSELEDRLAAVDLETQRLEKLCENISSEKDKLKDNYNSQIAELELTVQAAESEASHLKEQMSKMKSVHEKEMADLKHSSELQLSSLEENCQSLEKALSKQGVLLLEANSKYDRERGEREKSFDQQLSEAYEQARMYEIDISRMKRQMDEMKKDHQKDLQETHKTLENQVFDLENKCAIASSELERLRQSLWGMEQDHSSETQAMCHRIQELEALAHSQENQISDLQEKLLQSSQLSDDSMTTLMEAHQTDVAHLDEVNLRLKEDVERLQSQLKAMQSTHKLEIEALKHEHSQNTGELQEKCRQVENYCSVESASPTKDPEYDILQEEIKRLQEELVGTESTIIILKQRLKATQASIQTKALAKNGSLLQASAHDVADISRSLVLSEEAELQQQIKHVGEQLQHIPVESMGSIEDSLEKEKKTVGFVTEGGFEPEPDSLEYLDLAVGPKDGGDYFVEESEPNPGQKMRTKSVTSDVYFETVSEQKIAAQQQERSSSNQASNHQYQDRDTAGRFEPDVDEGRFEYSDGLRSESVIDGFQPESVPVSPSTQRPVTVLNPSFLPHPMDTMDTLAVTHTQIPAVEMVNSASQTDILLQNSIAVTPAVTREPLQADSNDAQQAAQESSLSDDDKTAVDAEVARKLKGLQDELEEEWVQKMRAQEVELLHEYDKKFEEFRRQVEHQCEQRIRNVMQDTQASFVDAVRKMRKSLEKKQRHQEREVDDVVARRTQGARGSMSYQDIPDTSDDERLGDIVKQLHEENQELAEVRDVLLQQIAISHTQGLRHTMQHELQAVVAGGNRLSPQSTLIVSPAPQPPALDNEETIAHQQQQTVQSASGRHTGVKSTAHGIYSPGQSTPLAGSDDEDDESGSICMQERFLEEVEEMSQQSGQDLPLEWELTSAAMSVSQADGSSEVTGIFEHDQPSGQSVWEVFDGRCLRQDCREVRHRYNNLFHWLSKICKIPPTHLVQGDSQGNGGTEGFMVQGEEQVEGWVASKIKNADSDFLSQILEGRDIPGETLPFSSSQLGGQEGNEHVPEMRLLSRLLSTEREKVHLEQDLNSRKQQFNQERRELEQKGVHLQARCDDLESSNRQLLQQIADLQLSCKQTGHEPTNRADDLPDKPCRKKTMHSVESSLQAEKAYCLHETAGSSQEMSVASCQEEKQELRQQLSAMQMALVAQQEKNVKQTEREKHLEEQCANYLAREAVLEGQFVKHKERESELEELGVKHQEYEAELEKQCTLLNTQVKVTMTENDTLRSDILIHQETEKELRVKCQSLAEKLEVMSDYEEIVHDRDDLQRLCSSLEVQVAASQKDLSEMQQENQNLTEENKLVTRNYRELKQIVEHLQDIENSYKALEARLGDAVFEKERHSHSVQHAHSSVQVTISETSQPGVVASRANSAVSEKDVKELQYQVGSMKEENRFLREKITILEENNKLLQNQCHTVQVRNRLLEYQVDAHNSRCEILQQDLLSVKEDLKSAEQLNKSLHDRVHDLESSRQKCETLERKNMSLSEEMEHLKEEDSSLKENCKTLEGKCQALQYELQEAKLSGQSLREQLHEQSMTLEHVISEMREEGFQENRDHESDYFGSDIKQGMNNSDHLGSDGSPLQFNYRTEVELRHQVSRLEHVLTEKDSLIAELKEQMTALSLQQAAVGGLPVLPESARDLEDEVRELREELVEKESIIQELQEQLQTLKQNQGELKRKLKEDSDLEQEVGILHQALFEKEKLIQELKETSKLLHLSQHEKHHHVKKHTTSSSQQEPSSESQERMGPTETKETQLSGSEHSKRKTDTLSSRSVESTESIAISSDSDISPGHDVDIVKEIGRLRKDIKKTKAFYANESALFQEALDRERVSHLGPRISRSSSLSVDLSEMTRNDIPGDPEQLKKFVVKLLEENNRLTMENLRLQLRIREQEALVMEMEGKLQKIKHPPDDWQPLFERQLLLLQKQRDELQHLICERDTGVGLLSGKIGKESVHAAAIQKQQEDLTVKIGELEHCHQLLQQRQAELAHCQAEKRHLEQILLLKDETERQLMRQKRLLEEELSTIEVKLQDREATLVEEKTRLMKELKEKEQHIFHLQSTQLGHPKQCPSQRQAVLMAGPQGASTPFLTRKFEASQAFFMQPLSPEEQDPSILHKAEEGAERGSFLEEAVEDPKSSSFEEPKHRALLSHPSDSYLLSRRHSTGALGAYRPMHHMPRDPNEMDRFHREAVDLLREKLRLQMEEKAQLSEGQASAITGYWQRHGNQQPEN